MARDTGSTTPATPYRLPAASKRVFAGLMLGMFVASVSQTMVGPAMPRIVAELGGMAHYSWVATAAMLVSAVTIPIVGKLSDLYGRRPFYLAGIVIFTIGLVVCGFAPNFWTLVVGRAIQGVGMGTLMPLSQTIIGDLVPPRQRGKYQGLMGAVFGVTSVAGPIAGGVITDVLGWRWLFFATAPVGIASLLMIARFLKLPHQRRDAKIDVVGIVLLIVTLVTILLAVSWGGTSYRWTSAVILTLFAAGAVFLVAFILVERKASEPVIPLRLFKNRNVTWSNTGAFAVGMVMFGAIIYIPVYAQGVLGVNATNSGLILMPLMLGFIVLGIITGLAITRTGRYKIFMMIGALIMATGAWLLTRMRFESGQFELTMAMVVLGIGLGMVMQQFTLVAQNSATQSDMGIITASIQFFRNVGSTVGIAIFGAAMTSGLAAAVSRYLSPELAAQMPPGADISGSVLDPAALAMLPPQIAEAVRHGLGDRLHIVFLLWLPILAVVFLATTMIKPLALRETLADAEEAPVVADDSDVRIRIS